LAGVVDGHPDAEGQGGLALGDVAVADAVRAVGRDAEGGVESVEGLLAGLEAFLASRKLDSLIVTEVNPDHDPGGELARLVDGLVAALARQPLARPELRTICS
jgi:arginase family enzyme